jgi:hypothetical protein
VRFGGRVGKGDSWTLNPRLTGAQASHYSERIPGAEKAHGAIGEHE